MEFCQVKSKVRTIVCANVTHVPSEGCATIIASFTRLTRWSCMSRYWDDCSFIASTMIMHALQNKRPQLFRHWLNENRTVLGLDRGRSIRLRRPRSSKNLAGLASPQPGRNDATRAASSARSRAESGDPGPAAPNPDADELVCLIAIFRHADRTPKSKLKAVVSHRYFIDFFDLYRNKKGKVRMLQRVVDPAHFLMCLLLYCRFLFLFAVNRNLVECICCRAVTRLCQTPRARKSK